VCVLHQSETAVITRWFKYDRDYLCANKSQFVPVIFEPPCISPYTRWFKYDRNKLTCLHKIPVIFEPPCSISWLVFRSFAKFRKATIRFATSVRPSVRMEKLGSHWTDFHKILYLLMFRQSVEKIQVSLKSDKKNGYFTWRRFHIYDNISLNSSRNGKCPR
jgi:hypothetical protein